MKSKITGFSFISAYNHHDRNESPSYSLMNRGVPRHGGTRWEGRHTNDLATSLARIRLRGAEQEGLEVQGQCAKPEPSDYRQVSRRTLPSARMSVFVPKIEAPHHRGREQ